MINFTEEDKGQGQGFGAKVHQVMSSMIVLKVSLTRHVD